MTRYETTIEIDAAPDRVWRVLTRDVPRAPGEFGITAFDGEMRPSGQIRLSSAVAPGRTFRLLVRVFDPPFRMVWTGGMPFGLFTGTRTFTLTPDGGQTRFHMEEVFTGALSGPLTRRMPDLTPSFQTFADALKRKAETP